MVGYETKGIFENKQIDCAVVDSSHKYQNKEIIYGVKVELWIKNKKGKGYKVFKEIFYKNNKDYLSLLYSRREKITAKKYIKNLGLKPIKTF